MAEWSKKYSGYTVTLTDSCRFQVVELERDYETYAQAVEAIDRADAAKKAVKKEKLEIPVISMDRAIQDNATAAKFTLADGKIVGVGAKVYVVDGVGVITEANKGGGCYIRWGREQQSILETFGHLYSSKASAVLGLMQDSLRQQRHVLNQAIKAIDADLRRVDALIADEVGTEKP